MKRHKSLSRRQFLAWLAAAGAGGLLSACGGGMGQPSAVTAPTVPAVAEASPPARVEPSPTAEASPARRPTPVPSADQAYLGVARGSDPAALTVAALAAIGGIERFVKSGNDVILKPNICSAYYSYEYGATTNPDVVATLVRLCLEAGAKRVRVMDMPFGGTPERAYAKSGIADAVAAAGGEMEVMNHNKFRVTPIPEGQVLEEWKIYHDVMAADILINVPIAKHHNLARLSLGAKNLLGVIESPGRMHSDLNNRIADLLSAIRPTLTVVDAVRTLMRHGPTGGNLDDVKMTNTVIASHDCVAADAYAATFFELTGEDIGYVRTAAERGLGTMDLDAIKIKEVAV